jgi:hypothetical protein
MIILLGVGKHERMDKPMRALLICDARYLLDSGCSHTS